MEKPSQRQMDDAFRLYESAYRKWLKEFVPSEEEMACLMGLSLSVLMAMDPGRAFLLFLAGITGEKPSTPIA